MATEIYTIRRCPGWGADIIVPIECAPDAAMAVKVGLAAKQASLARANLARANLAGASLAGASLAGANLDGAYLARANLDGANLDGANLDGASLAGANLAGAYLARASLDGASLAGAYLAGAYLDGAKIRDAVVSRLLAYAGRMDGYVFYAFQLQEGHPKIMAGCRWFTFPEFRAHIEAEYPDTDKATETGQILDFLQARAAALGVEIEPAEVA